MEIIYFVLGVITVLSIGSIVIAVRVNNKLNGIAKSQENHQRDVSTEFEKHKAEDERETEKVYECIVREVTELNRNFNESSNNIYTNIRESVGNINKTMDSRFDKLESKIKNK
jgi:hypothetical protein